MIDENDFYVKCIATKTQLFNQSISIRFHEHILNNRLMIEKYSKRFCKISFYDVQHVYVLTINTKFLFKY